MTEVKLKRCPNPECEKGELICDEIIVGYHVVCEVCWTRGPEGETEDEATRLWNLISERVWR